MCWRAQEDAIRSTRAVLEDEVDPARLPAVQLMQGCHSSMQVCLASSRGMPLLQQGCMCGTWPARKSSMAYMQEHVQSASFVCFNLGFLPGGERSLVTQPDTTLAALQAALRILEPQGLISVLCYVGHPGAGLRRLVSHAPCKECRGPDRHPNVLPVRRWAAGV